MNDHTEKELERRFEEAKRRIQAEADEKIRALELARSVLFDDSAITNSNNLYLFSDLSPIIESSVPTRKTVQANRRLSMKRIRITQEIRKAIAAIEGTFSQQDLTDMIEGKYPGLEINRGSVSNAISRIVERGERIDGYRIELAQKGSGSAPHLYRKVKDEPSEADDRERDHVTTY